MEKHTITGLQQAEDREITIAAIQNGLPIVDVTDALFEVRDIDGNVMMRLTLGAGITFADSTFAIQLTDTNTADLVGKYSFECWYLDSANRDTLVAHGSLKFNPTFGRF